MLKKPGYLAAIWLSVFGVVFVVSGAVLFFFAAPQKPPTPQSFTISIQDPHWVDEVNLSVEKVTKSTFTVDLVVSSSNSPKSKSSFNQVLIDLGLPKGDSPAKRTKSDILGAYSRWTHTTQLPLASGQGDDLSTTVKLAVLGHLYGYETDGVDVATDLPSIDSGQSDASGNEDPPGDKHPTHVYLKYPIPNISQLSWLENAPSQAIGKDETWNYTLQSNQAAKATATNVNIERTVAVEGFLAAALFALGGSALISAFPEAFHERAKQREKMQAEKEAKPGRRVNP
jgi:hypothetical protein